MKTLILALLMGTQAQASDLLMIKATVLKLQPALQKNEPAANEIALAVQTESRRYGFEWKMFLSILNHESSLRKDPQNCLRIKQNCTGDYGIGQVRKGVWDKMPGMSFDGHRLLTEYSYAIGASAKVLNYYKLKYQKKEMNWYTRYHSNTPEYRAAYMLMLNKNFEKINQHLDVYHSSVPAKQELIAYELGRH